MVILGNDKPDIDRTANPTYNAKSSIINNDRRFRQKRLIQTRTFELFLHYLRNLQHFLGMNHTDFF